jgi:hypothetical protein
VLIDKLSRDVANEKCSVLRVHLEWAICRSSSKPVAPLTNGKNK